MRLNHTGRQISIRKRCTKYEDQMPQYFVYNEKNMEKSKCRVDDRNVPFLECVKFALFEAERNTDFFRKLGEELQESAKEEIEALKAGFKIAAGNVLEYETDENLDMRILEAQQAVMEKIRLLHIFGMMHFALEAKEAKNGTVRSAVYMPKKGQEMEIFVRECMLKAEFFDFTVDSAMGIIDMPMSDLRREIDLFRKKCPDLDILPQDIPAAIVSVEEKRQALERLRLTNDRTQMRIKQLSDPMKFESGHQGRDIIPSTALQEADGAELCEAITMVYGSPNKENTYGGYHDRIKKILENEAMKRICKNLFLGEENIQGAAIYQENGKVWISFRGTFEDENHKVRLRQEISSLFGLEAKVREGKQHGDPSVCCIPVESSECLLISLSETKTVIPFLKALRNFVKIS